MSGRLSEAGATARRIVLVFVDGFGWGESDPVRNPQHAYGGSLLRLPPSPPPRPAHGIEPVEVDRGGWATPLDAVLGVPGVPQSATGQTTLLSGRNAQALLGKHLTGFPNEALREMLLSGSVLRQVTDRGLRAGFLNAFRPRFFELERSVQLRFSATTVANLAADLPFFTLDDVTAHRSIYQEFTNADLRDRGFDVPLFAPAEAGRILGRRSADFDFLLYEYFQSDKAGHTGELDPACRQLARLDEFLTAVLDTAPADALVLLCSDHGNLEDATTRRHTENPVPLMAWGPGAREFVAGKRELTEVTPAIVGWLEESATGTDGRRRTGS